tara:strand:+ start:78 stop:416 length:339 start_codon:yes stop_codon:yes gene_type:complete
MAERNKSKMTELRIEEKLTEVDVEIVTDRLIQILAWYQSNIWVSDIFRDVYEREPSGEYAKEKMDKISKHGILYLWFELDGWGRERLIKSILKRYGSWGWPKLYPGNNKRED